ncbi:MAG: 1-acyl-sn-glycerol-3-phosphate acyltransferase [Clostridiales bacterium]|nr:1-acyl-sn-glycerol-3-phosphate acyltransferase [Clostridiales bacterium]
MKGFYNFMRFSFGWIFRLLYPVKIMGNKNNVPKDGKVVLISNHLTFREIPFLVAKFPGYRHFLAKKEFQKKRFVAWFFTRMGAFFVDRNNMDIGTVRTGLGYLKSNEGIAMFPEGTRNRTDESIQAVKGGAAMFAIKGQAPLVPVIFQRKLKPFRRTCVYVGEPIDLTEFYGKKFDASQMEQASKIIGSKMEEYKASIDDYEANKRWKKKNKIAVKVDAKNDEADSGQENEAALGGEDNQ